MASPTKPDQRTSGKKVAVVGAGVSGLAAAYKLKSHGFTVTVLEADPRAGGKLRSVSYNGLIWDEGANTMTESEPEVQCLLDDLGLREKQEYPISQNKRYIVRNGVPVLVPTNPIALIKSNFLSAKSKYTEGCEVARLLSMRDRDNFSKMKEALLNPPSLFGTWTKSARHLTQDEFQDL